MLAVLKSLGSDRDFYVKLALVLGGGVLMGLTPAPTEAFPLAWIAIAPLWLAIANCTRKQGIFYAIAWGFGYHGLALFWITGIHPMTWLGVPWLASLAIALFCWLFITFWGIALVATWTFAMMNLRRLKALSCPQFASFKRILIGVALWCLLERIWSAGPLWWTSLSYTQSPHNLLILQLAKLSGPTIVTAVIVAANACIAEAILNTQIFKVSLLGEGFRVRATKATGSPQILLAAALILLLGSHAIGGAIYFRPLAKENPLKIGIIQGNIPNDIKLFSEGYQRAMQRYTDGYKRLSDRDVDAVLTPEGALPVFLEQLKDTPIYNAILQQQTFLWLGVYRREADPKKLSYTNSIFGIDKTGTARDRFDKVKLVPLGEYIPFESVFGKLIDRLSPLEARMIAGKPTQTFATPWGKASIGICYESAFAEHFRRQTARGGEFILTASNNAHYAQTMPAQHHAQDVLRAIESDRWAARATNTGYSGIIDPRGRTIWRSNINTYEIHADTIYRRKTRTLYVRWGDWLVWLLVALAALSLVLTWQFETRDIT